MFESFKTRRRNRRIVDDLYAAVVERSREDRLFTILGLPDTVMGRFESLSIHVFLLLSRCRDEPELKPLAQDLVDRFMSDVEDSIREIGIGDVTVPKRMRKLAGMFYERVDAYDKAVSAGDVAALAKALQRHALPAGAPEADAAALATYMIGERESLSSVPNASILRGQIEIED